MNFLSSTLFKVDRTTKNDTITNRRYLRAAAPIEFHAAKAQQNRMRSDVVQNRRDLIDYEARNGWRCRRPSEGGLQFVCQELRDIIRQRLPLRGMGKAGP